MSQIFQTNETSFLEEGKKNTAATIAAGVVILLMGLLAIVSPFVAGLSVTLMVGIMLVIGGIGQLVFAAKTDKSLLSMTLGILTIVIGAYIVANPGVALVSLTVILAAYLIVSGIFEAFLSFQVRPVKGWGWALFSSIISIVLGAMIWSQIPLSGTWAIGILIGVRLFFSGWTILMYGLAARTTAKELIDIA